MKSPITFALCLAFTFLAHHDSAAQRRRAPAARRAAATAPAAAPATTLAPRVAWTISEQPYNEDGATTTLVSLQPMPLGAAPGARHALSFGLGLIYEGKSSANFKNVSLNLFSRSEACWFPPEKGITLTLDGQPMTLAYRPDAKGVDGVWWVTSEAEGGPCDETLIAYVSPATLSRLSKAKTLTGKIGEETFQFTATNLGALRAFVAKVAIPQLSPRPLSARPRR
jgi:hypothetical protein